MSEREITRKTRREGVEYRSRSSPADDVMGLKPSLASTLFHPHFHPVVPRRLTSTTLIGNPNSAFASFIYQDCRAWPTISLDNPLNRSFCSISLLLAYKHRLFYLLYSLFPFFRNISTFYPSRRIHAGTGLTRTPQALLYNLFSRYTATPCFCSLSPSISLSLSLFLSVIKKETRFGAGKRFVD